MICLQVRAFWAQLEAATNERQQAMFRILNTHLKHLAQRIETAVGELLEVPIISSATDPPGKSHCIEGILLRFGKQSCMVTLPLYCSIFRK